MVEMKWLYHDNDPVLTLGMVKDWFGAIR